jgi:HEAT repeat protein
MSFWKKIVSFFAASTDPTEAVRIFADPSQGADARRAQVALVEDLSDKFGEKSPESLARVTAAFGDLTRALADPESWIRATALAALDALSGTWRFEVDLNVVRAALEGALRLVGDGDPKVRERAASALAHLSDPIEERRGEVVACLRKLCDDPVDVVRARAVFTLGLSGDHASQHVPRVVEMLHDAHPEVREGAASALRMIGVPDPSAELVSTLIRMLHADPNERVRAGVANALGKVHGTAAGDVVAALVRAMDDGAGDVRHHAIFAFCDLGESGAAAIPKLAHMLSNPEHKEAAEFALKGIGTQPARRVLEQHGISPD